MTEPTIRTDWTRDEITALFDLPFMDLVYEAQTVHRAYHPRNEVQLSTLLSIKTGGCPEDCGYCSQSVEADSGVKATKLMDVRAVLQAAAQAKDNGSGRFCMGAAWRNPKERDMPALVEMIRGVREMGMETCMTLGMLNEGQAKQLADAGLDYYNHNIDTAPENYANVITTRTFEDRIETLENVRAAGINVCFGHDDVFDPWYPLGTGNMLQVLHMGLHVCQLMGYQQINDGLKLITANSARTFGLEDYGIVSGNPANLIILPAENGFEAVRCQVPVRWSIRQGRVIATTQPAQSWIQTDRGGEELSFMRNSPLADAKGPKA